ncbi:hypothetical protein E3T43_01260 [Cryobacterium sp. Hh7]|uniref:hypothetical protein n=1 Tax=Cryobacterium sp. Hh7 TaxID=1259159 RepID=UPI00106937DB|nr:hypothetical protein [Cryobacterium sp. Hh7]TFD61127.1 hypothetical protein E3T43_01260 [Cryobacterium sp. Hh7]
MDAFATFTELGVRLGRVFTTAEQAWITVLLQDASTYLREDVIGAQVFPQSTATFKAWPDGGRVDLPAHPVVSVGSVTRDGLAITFERRDSAVYVNGSELVEITFTYGHAAAPDGLKRWTMVLVSQVLLPLELKLGLTAGGLSSVAIDDFKAAFADAGESTGISLSDRNVEMIRRQYSTGTHVVGMR